MKKGKDVRVPVSAVLALAIIIAGVIIVSITGTRQPAPAGSAAQGLVVVPCPSCNDNLGTISQCIDLMNALRDDPAFLQLFAEAGFELEGLGRVEKRPSEDGITCAYLAP